METIQNLESFMPLLTFIIAFVAVFTGLGILFNMILSPVKNNQKIIQADFKELKQDYKEFREEMKADYKELTEIVKGMSDNQTVIINAIEGMQEKQS